VVYIPWFRVANYITGEQDHRMDVQIRFSMRPIGADKGGKAPMKARKYNFGLSNYRYTTITAFPVQIFSSLYYPCLVMMLSEETVHAVPVALRDRLTRHASLTLCLSFLYRYECQYGLIDRSNEILNVTPDMECGPRKYNIKGKNVHNSRGKS
jgi:hypothetical protein